MDTATIRTNIKRFFANPNTVTFIFVLALIIGLYFIYAYMVQTATKPVSIPYSVSAIPARTIIKRDDISSVNVSQNFVSSTGNTIETNQRNIVDKYVSPSFQIPANSFFYKEVLTNYEEAEKTVFDELPDSYTVYSLKVDFHTTYGCSIMPGNYIDLFVKTKDKENDNKLVFELFIKSIEVKSVWDKDYKDVFTSTSEDQEPDPAFLNFAVPKEQYELLKKAELIKDIEFIPVPRNLNYTVNPERTEIVNHGVEDYINNKSVYIAD